MWMGALLLSQAIVPYGLEVAFNGARLLLSIHDASTIITQSLAVLSTALIIWCDAALFMEGFKAKDKNWAKSNLDWVAWIAAVVLSSWLIWNTPGSTYAYRHYGRVDILLGTALLGVGTLCFDLLLTVHAIRRRRMV